MGGWVPFSFIVSAPMLFAVSSSHTDTPNPTPAACILAPIHHHHILHQEPDAMVATVERVRAAAPLLPLHINLFMHTSVSLATPTAAQLAAARTALQPAYRALGLDPSSPSTLPQPYLPSLDSQVSPSERL